MGVSRRNPSTFLALSAKSRLYVGCPTGARSTTESTTSITAHQHQRRPRESNCSRDCMSQTSMSLCHVLPHPVMSCEKCCRVLSGCVCFGLVVGKGKMMTLVFVCELDCHQPGQGCSCVSIFVYFNSRLHCVLGGRMYVQVENPELEQKTQTDVRVQALSDLMREEIGHHDAIPYFQFVINPKSFTQTVENMLDCSFLIRKGLCRIVEQDGIPFIRKSWWKLSMRYETCS